MKRFKIKNKVTGLEFQVEREELGKLEPEWGKPEHTIQVLVKEAVLDAEGNELEPAVYEDQVVPAEFDLVVEDITQEIELKKIIDNRRSEYPSIEELVEAICEKEMEGRPEKWNEIKTKRAAVKAKYPKPSGMTKEQETFFERLKAGYFG